MNLTEKTEKELIDLMDACAGEVKRRALEEAKTSNRPNADIFALAAASVKTMPAWMRRIEEVNHKQREENKHLKEQQDSDKGGVPLDGNKA